jgi:hypothetical protein
VILYGHDGCCPHLGWAGLGWGSAGSGCRDSALSQPLTGRAEEEKILARRGGVCEDASKHTRQEVRSRQLQVAVRRGRGK